MDLKIFSLTKSPHQVEFNSHILGTEKIPRSEIQRNSDGGIFQTGFSLAKIQQQNQFIKKELLADHPDGVNMYLPEPERNNAVKEADTLTNHIKKVSRPTNNNGGRAKITRLEDLNFCYTNNGQSWEQGYQFVKIATSEGDVIKASYRMEIELVLRNAMCCSEQIKSTTIPIQIIEGTGKPKCIDVTKPST